MMIGLPVITPILCVAFDVKDGMSVREGLKISLSPIRDGQLAWLAMTFCTATLYESGAFIVGYYQSQGSRFYDVLGAMAVTGGLGYICARVATAGSLNSPPITDALLPRPYLFWKSVVSVIGSASVYTVVHFWLEGLKQGAS
jgi:hypothetical protein